MPPRPMFDQPLTPAQKQARYRARKALKRSRETEEALFARRHSLGKVAFYLAGQPGPEALAHVLAELDGPTLPCEAMEAAAGWLARFVATYRQAITRRQTSLTEMHEPASDSAAYGEDPRPSA